MRFLAVLSAAPITVAAAQIGRLPLLAALPATGGTCRNPATVTDALRRSGIARLLGFNGGSPTRLVSVGVDTRNRPVHLMVIASVPAGASRREGESLTVFFTPTGGARNGTRRFTTSGTPANRDEDRRSGLLPADTAAAFALAQAVAQRCSR